MYNQYILIFFLLIFTKQIFSQNGLVDHWEIIVNGKENWRYFPADSEPDAQWNSISFNDSLWLLGTGGIGFGNNDDNTVISKVNSLYIRKKFTLINKEKITQLLIQAQYDDGYIAYLNGYEVARSNMGDAYSFKKYSDSAISVHVSKLSKNLAPNDYLIDVAQLKYALQNGDNEIAVQIHNAHADTTGITALFNLYAGMADTTSLHTQLPIDFIQPPIFASSSNLPLLLINTNGQTIVDTTKITARLKILDNGNRNYFADTTYQFDGLIGIKSHGQSSLEFKKHSYGFETRDISGVNLDTSLLGLPSENDWILYAPYSDKSLLRNVFTYKLWNNMGHYSVNTKYCEVFLNGNYRGVYILIEKIKRDKNRVNIAKLKTTDTIGDNVTGGYIFKADKMPIFGINAWYSEIPIYKDYLDQYFQYVYPDANTITASQKIYIQSFVDSLQKYLVADTADLTNVFTKYLDETCAIDKIIISELSKDIDSYRYSQYFHKDKNSKDSLLHFGPIWDVDLGYGNVDYGISQVWKTTDWLYNIGGPIIFWYDRMMADEHFKCNLKARWKALRETTLHEDTLFASIDLTVNYINEAQNRNHYKWNTLGRYVWPNKYVADTYTQEINYVKNWLHNRLTWMDENLSDSCKLTGITTSLTTTSNANVITYPNPFTKQITFRFNSKINETYTVHVFDIMGKEMYTNSSSASSDNLNQLQWNGHMNNGNTVAKGIYFYSIKNNTNIIMQGRIVKQ